MISGNEDFELLQVALGDAPLEVEHLDADNLPAVEVNGHDSRRIHQCIVDHPQYPVVALGNAPERVRQRWQCARVLK